MASASPKEKFDAAIKVIHSLPEDGPFQPSKEMKLTFYGLYKQATEGPCIAPKPSFWDIIKKAKWEAWHALGDMREENAMIQYVDELKKIMNTCSKQWNEMSKNGDPRIVEAMPQTQVVGEFLSTLGNFYEMVDEESPIEMARKADPDSVPAFDEGYNTASPHSRNTSFEESSAGRAGAGHVVDDGTGEVVSSGTNHSMSSDSDEEFCDTSMDLDQEFRQMNGNIPNLQTPVKPAKQNHVRFAGINGRTSPTENGQHEVGVKENVHVPQAFPYIGSTAAGFGSHDGGAVVESSIETRLHNLQLATAGPVTCAEADWKKEPGLEGGEENDPPDGRNARDKDKSKSSQGQRSTSRRSGGRSTVPGSSSGGRRQLLSGGAGGGGSDDNAGDHTGDTVNEHIAQILVRLQQDMTSVLDRLNRLETQSRQTQRPESPQRRSSRFNWWPFTTQTGRAAFFFLIWPVVVHLVLSYMFRRRRRR